MGARGLGPKAEEGGTGPQPLPVAPLVSSGSYLEQFDGGRYTRTGSASSGGASAPVAAVFHLGLWASFWVKGCGWDFLGLGCLGNVQKARDPKPSPETGQEAPSPGWVPRRPRWLRAPSRGGREGGRELVDTVKARAASREERLLAFAIVSGSGSGETPCRVPGPG